MQTKKVLLGVLCAGTLFSGAAFAQDRGTGLDATDFAPIDATRFRDRVGLEAPTEVPDVNVQLKAGVAGYTGNLGDSSRAGPLIGVSVGAERWNLVGVEVGYEGSRNGVDDAFADGGALYRHNASGLLKVGPNFGAVHPFVGAGLGLSYVNANDEATAGGFRNDIMQEIPLAAGLEVDVGRIDLGVRTAYRVLVNDEFASTSGGNPSGGLLTGAVTLGGRF